MEAVEAVKRQAEEERAADSAKPEEPMSDDLKRAAEMRRRSEIATNGNADGERPPTPPKSPGKDNPHQNRAVFEICLLAALMLGLPPGEALYHGDPISWRMASFTLSAVAFVVFGSVWPTVKKRFPAQWWVSTLGRMASGHRLFLLTALLIVFIFVDGPDIYRRATETPSQTVAAPLT